MHLPDVNVWLALTFDSHFHHPVAKTWFDGLPSDFVCFFCRLTQSGFSARRRCAVLLAEFCSGFGAYDPKAEAWREPLKSALLP